MLDELARRARFTWRDSFAVFAEVPIAGKTYTELLSVNGMSLGVSFPEGWFDSSISLVGSKQDSNDKKSLMHFSGCSLLMTTSGP